MNNKMPLIVFNYYHDDIEQDVTSLPSGQNFVTHTRTIQVPRHAMNSSWTLVGVNANFNEDKRTDWVSLDVEIPELMTTQNVLYSNVSIGGVEIPKDSFRFYTKMCHLSQQGIDSGQNLFRQPPSYNVVSEYPDWVLGKVKLESTTLTCKVTPRMGNVDDAHEAIQLNGISIILSYEQ